MVRSKTNRSLNKTKLTLFVVLIIAVFSVPAIWFFSQKKTEPVLMNYEDCVAAGYAVEESNPPKCTTPDGWVYTKHVDANDSSDSDEIEKQYVGLNEKQAKNLAKKQDRRFRVISRDGKELPITLDFSRGRVNAYLENDKVVKIQIENDK